MRLDSLRSRLILAALVWVLLATILGGLALSASFRRTVADSFDQRAVSLLNTLIGTTEVAEDGTLSSARPLGDPQFDTVYSGWYWLVSDGSRILLSSRSLWDLDLTPNRPPPSATAAIRTLRDPQGRTLRVFEQTLAFPGTDVPLTFMLTADGDALARELAEFNLLLWGSLAALGVGLVIAVVVQVSFGLRPVKQLADEVGSVRKGRTARLSPTGTRELDLLVDEVNTLIDHNRAHLKRARSNAGDLAHALKTPLAVLRSRLAEGTPAEADEERELVHVMQRIIDRQLSRVAASGPRLGSSTSIAPAVAAVLKGMSKIYAERSLDLKSDVAPTLLFAGDDEDLEEMLGNLLDNACKWARSQVRVSAARTGATIVLTVEDDGPGMNDTQIALAIERGQRFDSSVPGSGLGLAIVSDLIELYGGRLRLARSDLGGLRVEVEVPGA